MTGQIVLYAGEAPDLGAGHEQVMLPFPVAQDREEDDMPATISQMALDILEALDCPTYLGNVVALAGWKHAEQGETQPHAAFNPFNTTLRRPRSTDLPGNTAHVQEYPSYTSGVLATVMTIQDSRHSGILAALKTGPAAGGSSQKVWAAIKADATWGSSAAIPADLGAYDLQIRNSWALYSNAEVG